MVVANPILEENSAGAKAWQRQGSGATYLSTLSAFLRYPLATPLRAAIVVPLALAWPHLIYALNDAVRAAGGQP